MASATSSADATLAAPRFKAPMRAARARSVEQEKRRNRVMAPSTQPLIAPTSAEEFDFEALRRGDSLVFSTLVRRYHRVLLTVARGMVGSDEAEAIVQESWLKAFLAIARFEGRSSLRTWLTTIVMNEARMYLRKQPRREISPVAEHGESFDDWFDADGRWLVAPARWNSPGPEDAMRAEQFGQCLARLLDELPPQQRLVLELRDVQQRALTDIADYLQLAEGNVRVLLHRARARVYRGIERYEESGQC